MKIFCTVMFLLVNIFNESIPNKAVEKVDLNKFGGTWYSLYSIPTMFDRGSRETTTHYTLNKDSYYDVVTTCKEKDGKIRTVTSKIIPTKNNCCGQMKAQFIWPIKIDYWIIDLAPDYSWAVVGHPDHRFLFIMSRKPQMDKSRYEQIILRCKAMGYPIEQLVSQQFSSNKDE